MPKGIVVKIWNVSSNSGGRSSARQIGDSIDYIFNAEKCSEKLDDSLNVQMGRELAYVTNDVKTLEGLYVGARNIIDLDHASDEMIQIKEYYGKLDGRAALHGTISLDALESDKANAGKLMMLCDELLKEIFGDYQAVYAVHTNTQHLHVHFIVNTVGLGGKKIHMDKDFMKKVFQPAINKLAVKYGFTENEEWKKEQKKDLMPIAERKIAMRKAIDLAIEESESFTEFVNFLVADGYKVNVGKYLSLQTEDMSKAMRSFRLGEFYTVDSIKNRIMHKRDNLTWLEMNAYAKGIEKREMLDYVPGVLKKYKDMSADEKRRTVQMLRVGKNPWRLLRESNWQINRAANQLSIAAYTREIVFYYDPNSTNIATAKQEIKNRQKLIRQERKAIKENLKQYKPIVDLYEQMKLLEVPAYLYDVEGKKEFEEAYEQYKELSTRLLNGYGKTIEEVARFVENQNNQLLYSKAQENELGEQYKALIRYEKHIQKKQGFAVSELSFFDAVGHSEARQNARFGLLDTRLVYITADDVDDLVVRVKTTPDVIDGKPTVSTEVVVLDGAGTEIESISSKDMSPKEFNKALNEMKYKYQLNKCHVEAPSADGRQRKNASRH